MSVACYLEPEKPKADRWMKAFAAGCRGYLIRHGARDPRAEDHAVMGNWPVATKRIAEFQREGRGFWYLDSAYIQDTGRQDIRVERSRFWPVFREEHSMARARTMGVAIRPWRRAGRHVLVALHGPAFGTPWGIDMRAWQERTLAQVAAATDREVRLRPKPLYKGAGKPLAADLEDAWCLVTHSSTAAVTAALMGVPVFCEPTCAAAPVALQDYSRIDDPVYPEREPWIATLAWLQWSKAELQSGEAWAHLRDKR